MRTTKDKKIQVKATEEWVLKVRKAATSTDTSLSQFVREAVNDRLKQMDRIAA